MFSFGLLGRSRGSTVPEELILAYYAKNPLTSRRGPAPTWSYADESDPLVIDGGVYCGPAYTNALPTGSEDFNTWEKTDASAEGEVITFDDVMSSRLILFGSSWDISAYGNFSVELKGTPGEKISIEFSDNAEEITLTDTYQIYSVSGLAGNVSPGIRIIRRDAAHALVVHSRNPQLTVGPYLHPYILPGTSAVSRAGTVGGNGIGFDTSGTQEVADGVELWDLGDFTPLSNYDLAYTSTTSAIGDRAVFLFVVSGAPAQIHFKYNGTFGDYVTYELGSHQVVAVNNDNSVGSTAMQVSDVWEGSSIANISVQKLITIPEPKSLALRQAFEGKPDGVELWVDPTANVVDENSYSTWDTETGIGRIVSDGTYVDIDGVVFDLISENAYRLVFTLISQTGAILRTSSILGEHRFETGSETVVLTAAFTGTLSIAPVGACDVTFKLSVQKLNPAVCTATALVKMGVGSGELSTSTTIDLLICDDATLGLISARKSSSGDEYLATSSDNTRLPYILGTWDRNEIHAKTVRVSADGTQFQVGNKRYSEDGAEIDTAIQWSSLVAFDGSFDPEEYLRLFLNNTVPIGLIALEVWNKSASDDEILKYIERELPNA